MSTRLLSAIQKGHGLTTLHYVRSMAYYGPEIVPGVTPSLAERLAALNPVDPLSFKVDIGLPPPNIKARSQALERSKALAQIRKENNLERLARERKLVVPLDGVYEEWKKEKAAADIKMIADHYSIYDHLFGDAYFYPRVLLDVEYLLEDECMPVYRGNLIKPREALNAPMVSYEATPDSLWTLILTNPDGHLSEENAEYVHWFIGNIPGNNLLKGDTVYDYLPPFPPAGTGYHRFVFILYKQEKKMDFSAMKKALPCVDLSLRTFNTLDFYRERQDDMTPAGLAFYQCDYDSSVKDIYHKILGMKEPQFEYDFPEHYVKPQEYFPLKRAFNEYLDKYRDPKEINKEYIVDRLKAYDPFEKSPRKLKYPGAQRSRDPTWLQRKKLRDALRWGAINEAD